MNDSEFHILFDSLQSRGLKEAASVIPENLRKSIPVIYYGKISGAIVKEVNQASPLTNQTRTVNALSRAVGGQSMTFSAIQTTDSPIQNSPSFRSAAFRISGKCIDF